MRLSLNIDNSNALPALLRLGAATVLVLTLAAPSANGQQPGSAPAEPQAQEANQQQIDELRRRLEVLATEVERLRSSESEEREVTPSRRRALGLAPSAASAYRRTTDGVSFAGYGEMLLENFRTRNEAGATGAPTTRIDFLRAVLYTGYRFSDRFVFNSELEVEHASEVFVEFAYVDYLASDSLTIRGGLLLVPLGLVNEFHEPNVYFGAKRTETETRIIPSTWRENGAGVLGSIGAVNYRAYVTNGLNGAGFTSAGIRGGRQRGIQARAANLAFSGRLDVTPTPGVFAGVGLYTGGSGQEQVILGNERLDVGTTVAEVHGQAQFRGLDARVLLARATVEEAGNVNRALRLPTATPIADSMRGGYVQVGYNVLSQSSATVALTPYVRYERVDTQHRVPEGFTRDRSRDGTFNTVGIELAPIPNVVLKMDYQWITNAAGTGRDQASVNLGYSF